MVLPGMSGGTMAFILGLYGKIIDELVKFNLQQVKYLLNLFTIKKEKLFKNFSLLISPYDWFFILPLIAGSIFAVVAFIFIAPPFIEKYSLEFYSLVFGLIVVSLYSPFKEMKKNGRTFTLLILSFSINFLCFYLFKESTIVQKELPSFLFLPTGFLVAGTLIIPGISGSYLLILLGLYQTTLENFRDFNIPAIIFFLLGIVAGLVIMVRFIKIGLKKYFNESLAIILGLILGSLYGLWFFLEQSFGNQLHFETEIKLFVLYSFIPFLIVFIYNVFYRFLKKS